METFRTPLAQSSCLESLRGESGLINLQPPGPLSLLILPTSNGNGSIWWQNLELMQVAPSGGQIWN